MTSQARLSHGRFEISGSFLKPALGSDILVVLVLLPSLQTCRRSERSLSSSKGTGARMWGHNGLQPRPTGWSQNHLRNPRLASVYSSYADCLSQVKTEAKKRYLAKKAKRHKKLAKAKKDSAPKNKAFKPTEDEASSSDSDSAESEEEVEPVRAPAAASQPGSSTTPNMKATTQTAAMEVSEEDEEAAKERRKREKREKRANRDKSERKRRNEERKAQRTVESVGAAQTEYTEDLPGSGASKPMETMETEVEQDSEVEEAVDTGTGADIDMNLDRVSTPLLEAFPLPTAAPAPDPALLSRQGLPSGLEDATLIDQNLSIAVDDIEITRNGVAEKGVGNRMSKRLSEMGITDFFAGMSPI